jgi:extradiol dioxygenase family protein
MRFADVRLGASPDRLPALAGFYGERLGLEHDGAAFTVGETRLEFVDGAGEPFYHFALLVPGDRFEAALAWARERVELLSWPDSDEVVFDFDFWDAQACYFLDPAGNIVEFVAHRGTAHNGQQGHFSGHELVGLSELGLVGDQPTMAAALREQLGLEVWDGSLDEPRGLAFVGEKARTLILASPSRGWMPTGRPAERHALEVRLEETAEGDATVEGGLYRIRA